MITLLFDLGGFDETDRWEARSRTDHAKPQEDRRSCSQWQQPQVTSIQHWDSHRKVYLRHNNDFLKKTLPFKLALAMLESCLNFANEQHLVTSISWINVKVFLLYFRASLNATPENMPEANKQFENFVSSLPTTLDKTPVIMSKVQILHLSQKSRTPMSC